MIVIVNKITVSVFYSADDNLANVESPENTKIIHQHRSPNPKISILTTKI